MHATDPTHVTETNLMNPTLWRVPLLIVALILSAGAADAPPATAPAAVPHTFRFAPDPAATAVVVAGDFNGWSTTANPLARGDDGTFTATVDLSVGKHPYKFVVDGKWTNDPAADKALEVDDGQQGKNSVVDVQPLVPHTFRYAPAAGEKVVVVTVAGDFNGWSTTAPRMGRGADGTFTVTVDLPPGVHHYKFVVDDKWTNDPKADKALDADDGHEGKNSGVDVEPAK